MESEDVGLFKVAGCAAGTAFLCAAYYGFSRPVLTLIPLLGLMTCFVCLFHKPDLSYRPLFRDLTGIIGMITLGTMVGEGIWLEVASS